MRVITFVLFAMAMTVVHGQEPARPGIVRGALLQVGSTSLVVTTSSGDPVQCGFDSHTYMEKDGQRIFAGALHVSDPVEVIADRKAASCYARTLRVVAPGTRILPIRRSPLEYIYPRGNLAFSGVVRRLNSEVVVLRTREEPEKLVLLREDTRYLDSGSPTDLSRLGVNTRVFIRGGKNIDNQLEAYQIIWGDIGGPSPGHDE